LFNWILTGVCTILANRKPPPTSPVGEAFGRLLKNFLNFLKVTILLSFGGVVGGLALSYFFNPATAK
jgi:hypothetical protein